jgi:hypothetical protein
MFRIEHYDIDLGFQPFEHISGHFKIPRHISNPPFSSPFSELFFAFVMREFTGNPAMGQLYRQYLTEHVMVFTNHLRGWKSQTKPFP